MSVYPVFLRLAGRNVLVVGAGPVAAEKAKKLVDAGAVVRTVAPDTHPDYARLGLAVEPVAFSEEHLDGVFFVVAAAPSEVNRRVFVAAEARGLLVLAVDDPAHASAFGGSVVTRGDVTVLVGTGGRAPALAGLLREALDELLPHDLGAWVDTASALRPSLAALGLSFAERRQALLATLVKKYASRAGAAQPARRGLFGAWVDTASALRPRLAALGLFSKRPPSFLATLVEKYGPRASATKVAERGVS